jgi:hypothetical protein
MNVRVEFLVLLVKIVQLVLFLLCFLYLFLECFIFCCQLFHLRLAGEGLGFKCGDFGVFVVEGLSQVGELLLESAGHVLKLLEMVFGGGMRGDGLIFLAQELFHGGQFAFISLELGLTMALH